MPFSGPLDVTVVNDAGDDRSREYTVREGDKVVKEPGSAGTNQGPPVPLDYKIIWHIIWNLSTLEKTRQGRTSLHTFDCPVAVKLRTEHANSEVEDRHWKEDSKSERETPDSVEMVFSSDGKKDQEDGYGQWSSELWKALVTSKC